MEWTVCGEWSRIDSIAQSLKKAGRRVDGDHRRPGCSTPSAEIQDEDEEKIGNGPAVMG